MDDKSVTIEIPQTPAQEVTPPVKPQIKRNKKGQITKGVAQDTNKNGTAGSPCEFCQNKEKYQKITDDYLLDCRTSKPPKVPFVQELADILNCDKQTIREWEVKKNDDIAEHPEFAITIKSIWNLQELRLLNRTLARNNPTGAIFQLKVNHKYVETEKKILGSDDHEPLKIIITEERKIESDE